MLIFILTIMNRTTLWARCVAPHTASAACCDTELAHSVFTGVAVDVFGEKLPWDSMSALSSSRRRFGVQSDSMLNLFFVYAASTKDV